MTSAEIESALMRHPYIETVRGDLVSGEAVIRFRKARDARELTKRLGTGTVEKVPGFRLWIARIPVSDA